MQKFTSKGSSHSCHHWDKSVYCPSQISNSVPWNSLLKKRKEKLRLSTHNWNYSDNRIGKRLTKRKKSGIIAGFFITEQPLVTIIKSTHYSYPVVVSLSKVKISKAIHNKFRRRKFAPLVVVSLSKVKISKAIHNYNPYISSETYVVVSLSKVKISKAIHNQPHIRLCHPRVVVSLSKVKISKAIHNKAIAILCNFITVKLFFRYIFY